MLEYFISTHGARKGLADTALKTADAGYLTRRLVDVSHDVIINEEDCGTLRGLIATAIKSKDEIVESLGERILGRTSVHDIFNPLTGELIIPAGEEITEDIANLIESLPIEQVEIRSVLTCESRNLLQLPQQIPGKPARRAVVKRQRHIFRRLLAPRRHRQQAQTKQ